MGFIICHQLLSSEPQAIAVYAEIRGDFSSEAMTAYSTLLQDATAAQIQPILDLSNCIFGVNPSTSATHHGVLEEWQKRLDDPVSIIAYGTMNQPLGFIFAHPKHHGQIDQSPALHLWLAGVLPTSRGSGMFHKLMKMIETHAHLRGIKRLSVATFPAKFEKMYSILIKTGWTEVQRWEGGKVLLMKDVLATGDDK